MKQDLEDGDVVYALTIRKMNHIRYGQRGIIRFAYVNNLYEVEFENNRCQYSRDELEHEEVQAATTNEVLQKSDFSQVIDSPVAEEIEFPILNA